MYIVAQITSADCPSVSPFLSAGSSNARNGECGVDSQSTGGLFASYLIFAAHLTIIHY